MEIFHVVCGIARRVTVNIAECKVPRDPVINARSTVINPFPRFVFCACEAGIWEEDAVWETSSDGGDSWGE